MTSLWVLPTVLILVLARQAHSQNAPNDPLWPLFAELLSNQTGRTVQDIYTLGLSDPTINQLWTSYSANMPSITGMTNVPPTTTPPPLPALPLYQTSYSFSTNTNTNPGDATGTGAQTSMNTAGTTDPNAVYAQLLNMISQPSTSGTGAIPSPSLATDPTANTMTSMQDVMNAYAQLSGATAQAPAPAPSPTSTGQDPMQALLQQYSAAMGSSSSLTGTNDMAALMQQALSGGGQSPTPTQTMVDLLNQGPVAGTNTAPSPGSYEQLLQQYNQIMGTQTPAAPSTSTAGSTSTDLMNQYMALMSGAGSTGTAPATTTTTNTNDQLMQMLSMLGSQPTAPAPAPAPATNTATNAQASTTASAGASPSTSGQETFEQQLKTYFPQFQSLFPSTSSGASTDTSSTPTSTSTNDTASNPTAPNSAQAIFDALLFGPSQAPASTGTTVSQTKPAPSTNTNTSPTSPLNALQNMVSLQSGSNSFIQEHMQNVLKTRASRDMGCRFLPELLELDVLPTAPINCMNRCPFPYINSQKFGMYCMCCPPGVNDQVAGVMSLLRSAKYMESPLMVTV